MEAAAEQRFNSYDAICQENCHYMEADVEKRSDSNVEICQLD